MVGWEPGCIAFHLCSVCNTVCDSFFSSLQIDMLQAEVTALKTLVITSTPSSPNRELHPQLQSPSKAAFRKGHGRNKSTSSTGVAAASQHASLEPVGSEFKEVGQVYLPVFHLEILGAGRIGAAFLPREDGMRLGKILRLEFAASALLYCRKNPVPLVSCS